MSSYRYQALGPLQAGEGSRAFLGLAISGDNKARPVVIIWVPEAAEKDPESIHGNARRYFAFSTSVNVREERAWASSTRSLTEPRILYV